MYYYTTKIGGFMFLKNENSDASTEEQLETFKKLTTKISFLLSAEGVKIRPYVDGLPHFTKLPYEKKQSVIDYLQFYCNLCVSQVSEGYRIKDSSSFTWRALRQLGLVPRSDLFQHMTDEMVCEIYSPDHVQLFRNFKFFEFCSYSLEELHCIEWWFLYERDAEINALIMDQGLKVATGEIPENIVPNIPRHILRERDSMDKISLSFEFTLFGPLYQSKKACALILLGRGTVLEN
jgi:hypothetical protein